MISLTNRPNRVLTWSLWIVLATLASVCLGVILWVGGAGVWSLLAAGVLGALLLVGRGRPALASRAYLLWRRLTRGVERRALAVLTRTAFLVVSIAGWAGADRDMEASPGTQGGWRERRPLSAAYGSLSAEAVPAERHGWLVSLMGWARRSGNVWILALVPLLGLLRLVYGGRTATGGGTTYTLY